MIRTRLAGGKVMYAHAPTECQFEGQCCIHSPSIHAMMNWPQEWVPYIRQMFRVCEHGMFHPDPDDVFYRARVLGQDSPHYSACDGCCPERSVSFNER